MAHCVKREGPTSPTIEESAIQELRLKISDIISADEKFDDDFYLLQWLKAQKLDPGKTENMLRKSLEWRQEHHLHSKMEDEFPPEHLDKFKVVFSKSKDGMPVAYMNVGAMNFKSGLTAYGKAKWIQLWSMVYVQAEDQMIAYNKAKNVNTTRITSDCTSGIVTFIDTKDFSSLQLLNLDVLRCCVENVTNLMGYFPAIVGPLFFYNMNSVFKLVFNAFKSLLAVLYISLEVYGTDEKVWRKRLLEVVDAEKMKELEDSWT